MKEMNRCGSYFNSTYLMIGTCRATIDVFTNSEYMNLRYFFILLLRSKNIYTYITIHFHKKHFTAPLKENKKNS